MPRFSYLPITTRRMNRVGGRRKEDNEKVKDVVS